MSARARRAEESKNQRFLIIERGEEDDPENIALLSEPLRQCPECRGSCEDKNGDPCEICFGEGEI